MELFHYRKVNTSVSMDSLGCMSVMIDSAPCEMELSDYEETFTFEMAYDVYQNSIYSGTNINVMKMVLGENEEDFQRTLFFLQKDKEKIEREEMERIKFMKFMTYMLLLSILFGNNSKCKFLATPDRLKIGCITVYLLGNDGAHSYNGNGIWLSTRRKYTRFKDEELLDEIRPANLPLDVLQRQPTDKEIARISGKIGKEYRRLAYELGLTRVQLDHLTEDYRVTEHRIERMLFKWRDGNGRNATFEILVNALDEVGINPDIVSQSLERA